MSIVAISPTIGSLGDEIGREVARARGYEFADREIIEKASARFGEGVMELAHATEEKPTLWERFVDTAPLHDLLRRSGSRGRTDTSCWPPAAPRSCSDDGHASCAHTRRSVGYPDGQAAGSSPMRGGLVH